MTSEPVLSYEQLLDWLRNVDEALIEQRGYLTELDSAVGDGDHGINLARGGTATSAKVDAEKPEYLDQLFRLVGMTLISTVGGASGPLYGTFFLRVSLSVGHRQELTLEQLADALDAGVAGVVERGRPELGDKTMFDAMEPAVRAFRASLAAGAAAASRAAFEAAAAGRDATAELVARKGRASYLGDRSLGHIDPGAASTALLFQALAEALA
jgi:phosphoenolpyruvate---glycerone phosphotransferase subunit DhaL